MATLDVPVLLRRAGLRPTTQRVAVLDAIAAASTALTAQDLYSQLRERGGGTGLTTVYRTLSALAEAGVLDTFEQAGEQGYRLCSADHHHHLVCVQCGVVEEVEGGEVEDWVKRTARSRRFRVSSHRADIYGRCRRCA
jgi:Fur family ferric uptake transcriptional regulator